MSRICLNRLAVIVCTGLLVTSIPPVFVVAQRVSGDDTSRMRAYRALATLTYQALERGDQQTAVRLAEVLDLTWNRGELGRMDPVLWKKIDRAMDRFIRPLRNSVELTADAQKNAYKEYLAQLKAAD